MLPMLASETALENTAEHGFATTGIIILRPKGLLSRRTTAHGSAAGARLLYFRARHLPVVAAVSSRRLACFFLLVMPGPSQRPDARRRHECERIMRCASTRRVQRL